jgi:WD40 repeat-containing protein SMU1
MCRFLIYINFDCKYLGKWIYCVGEDGVLYAFDALTSALEGTLEISSPLAPSGESGREVIGVTHHGSRNLIATITDDGVLKTWRP